MYYKYLYAKHLDACQKQVLAAHDLLKTFHLDIVRIAHKAEVNAVYHEIMLNSSIDVLNAASNIIAELQKDVYSKPPTIKTDDDGVLFVKQTGAGIVLTTEEPDELHEADELNHDFDDQEDETD